MSGNAKAPAGGGREAEPAGQAGTGSGSQPDSNARWSGRTRGGVFGNWFFLQLIRLAGVWAAYAWLLPVAAYFTVIGRKQFRISMDYLRRVLGPRPALLSPLLVYRHFVSFGVTLIDRAAVIMGKGRVRCEFQGEELFRRYLDRGQGVILLGAHVGGWEVASQFLCRFGIPVNLVVWEKEEQAIRRVFDQMLKGKKFRLLTTDVSPLRSVAAMAALRRGEIVALHGDRTFGGASVAVPFLGGTAEFPVGAYVLAAATGAPLFHVFAVRERMLQYRFFSYPAVQVPRESDVSRRDRFRQHAEQYADRLAEVLRQYPFQWYNFYSFWESKDGARSAEQSGTGNDKTAA